MSIKPGRYEFGPQNAELLVHTRRTGAAAKAGHDLVIEVGSWSGRWSHAEDPSASSVALNADGSSLRVREGKGGIQALGDDDKDSIKRSIDEDVLKRSAIEFRSRSVTDGPTIRVDGDLRLLGSTRPISFELKIGDDRRLTGSATIRQREWGIKPYTILFGTLKVADEVQVTVDATLEG